MIGACIIDGTDIATLGVLILRGGDHDFISFPQRKDPLIIEWPDADGFEIGSDAPVYEAKKLTVNYYLKGDETNFQARLNAFVGLHEAAGYRAMEVREFAQTFQLRYAGVSGFSMNRGFSVSGEKSARISIDYVMDDPLQFIDSEIVAPTENRPFPTHVQVGGVDLSAFGIVVHETYPTALCRTPKGRMVYTSQFINGNITDTSYAAKKGKQDITIRCTMLCADRETFLMNYSALFNALNVSSFTLTLSAAGKQFKCFYNAMDGFKKRPWTGRGIAGFNLKLVGCEI